MSPDPGIANSDLNEAMHFYNIGTDGTWLTVYGVCELYCLNMVYLIAYIPLSYHGYSLYRLWFYAYTIAEKIMKPTFVCN